MGVKVNGKIYTMQSQLSGDVLKEHMGHQIVIVGYAKRQIDQWENPQNIALECADCSSVLADCEVTA